MDPLTTAEQVLAHAAAELVAPRPDECLYHYLCRMLDEHGWRAALALGPCCAAAGCT